MSDTHQHLESPWIANRVRRRTKTVRGANRRSMLLYGASLLALLWFLVGPWPRGWAEHHFWSGDLESLNHAAWEAMESQTESSIATGPLDAGVAVVDLTQRIQARIGSDRLADLPLAGYGKRAFHLGNDGLADPLYVKALTLENSHTRIVLIAADLLYVNRVIVNRVRAKLAQEGFALRRDQLVFSATHTHSGVAGYTGKLLECVSTGRHRADVTAIIVDSIVEAVMQAWRDVRPARFASASIDLSECSLMKNRLDPSQQTNDWLDLVFLEDARDGSPLASVAVFAAHATCRSSKDRRISGDYPGVFTSCVQCATGAPCLFLAGPVGSMGPGELSPSRDEWSSELGVELANQALDAYHSPLVRHRELSLASVGTDLRLPAPVLKLADDVRLSPIAAGVLGPTTAYLQAVRLGPILLLPTPADFSGSLAESLRDRFPSTRTLVTSFNGDYVGYILADADYDKPSYEPRKMAILGPHAGSFFMRSLTRMSQLIVTK